MKTSILSTLILICLGIALQAQTMKPVADSVGGAPATGSLTSGRWINTGSTELRIHGAVGDTFMLEQRLLLARGTSMDTTWHKIPVEWLRADSVRRYDTLLILQRPIETVNISPTGAHWTRLRMNVFTGRKTHFRVR